MTQPARRAFAIPPHSKAGNEMEPLIKPPAVFRVAASGSRFWPPWPAPVGDLDPDNVVHRLDRNRHRLAGSTRAAVLQTIKEKLAHQQRSHVPARVTGAWMHPLSLCTSRRLHRRAAPRTIRDRSTTRKYIRALPVSRKRHTT